MCHRRISSNAAVRAGVQRFAPSEWTSSSFDLIEWYAGKIEIRELLKTLNKDKKVPAQDNQTYPDKPDPN